METERDAAPGDLVYRRGELAQWRDVAKGIDRARRAASSIVKDARKAAKMKAVRSAARLRARERDADRAFVARAMALEEAYRLARISLTSDLEATLDRVLAAALASIGAQLPADERLRVLCKQLAKAAGPIAAARLCLCTADASRYRAADLPFEWPLRIDDALLPGHCRLVTDHGEWALEFDAVIASLIAPLTPLTPLTPPSTPKPDNDATDKRSSS
jgi:flagellar biosynthesis/type III secretory pathway protein FliH